MTSEDAAEWLINTYPINLDGWGEALILIPHRSWLRADQKRLANYYFKKLPYAHSTAYEAFASFMSIKTLLNCIRARLPMNPSDTDLLLYCLIPALRKFARNHADNQLIADFIIETRKDAEN